MLTKLTKNTVLIFIVAILTWLTLAAWALSSPIGASPDEDFHQTMIYCAGGKTERCSEGGARYGHCYTMRPTASANCSSYANLSEPKASQVVLGHYPPLYYSFMALFIGDNLSTTTILVRLANVTLMVFFALGSIILTQQAHKPAVVISWLVASMPTGMYFLSSLNPTAWIILSIASAWGPFLSIFKSNDHKALNICRIVFIILVCIMGFGSRGEAILWIPIMFITILILILPIKISLERQKIIKIVFFIALLLLPLFLLLDSYASQKISRFLVLSNSFGLALEKYFYVPKWPLIQNTFNILFGVTGIPGVPGSGLGTHDVPVPAMAFIFIAYALCSCIVIGITRLYVRKVIAISFLISSILIITSFLWTLQDWDYLQGRYFLPLLFPLIGLFLLSKDATFVGTKWQLLSILLSLAVANCLVLLSISLRFVYGVVYQSTRYPLTPNAPDINPSRLFVEGVPSWWWPNFPFGPSDLWIIGSVCFASLMIIIWRWLCSDYFNERSINLNN